jgi:hypothetical protein
LVDFIDFELNLKLELDEFECSFQQDDWKRLNLFFLFYIYLKCDQIFFA